MYWVHKISLLSNSIRNRMSILAGNRLHIIKKIVPPPGASLSPCLPLLSSPLSLYHIFFHLLLLSVSLSFPLLSFSSTKCPKMFQGIFLGDKLLKVGQIKKLYQARHEHSKTVKWQSGEQDFHKHSVELDSKITQVMSLVSQDCLT